MAKHDYLQGLVLKERAFGEADALIVFLGEGVGKISLVAKGIKKQNSRLRSSIQPLHFCAVETVQGKGLPLLIKADVLTAYDQLRQSYLRTMVALYYLDAAAALLPEGVNEDGALALLLESLSELVVLPPWLSLFRFEWRLLLILGYATDFSYCHYCGRTLRKGQREGFADAEGGFYCADCRAERESEVQYLSSASIVFLERLAHPTAVHLQYLKLNQAAFDNLNVYLQRRYQNLLERPLKSREVLKTMISLDKD